MKSPEKRNTTMNTKLVSLSGLQSLFQTSFEEGDVFKIGADRYEVCKLRPRVDQLEYQHIGRSDE